MKLVNAIKLVATGNAKAPLQYDQSEEDHMAAARQFLFGENHAANNPKVSNETNALIARLGLDGSDFEFVGDGANATVYGNKKTVFKLESDDTDALIGLPIEEIPDGLTAKLIERGSCNGVKFFVSERLNTDRDPTLQEIIPFVFKAKDLGVLYHDIKSSNLGFDEEGKLKVLDLEHFKKCGTESFADYISVEMRRHYHENSSSVIADENATYVMIAHDKCTPEECETKSKKISASLKMAGVADDDVDMDGAPSVIRVKRTEITYGTPPQTESMEKFLSRALKVNGANADKAASFLADLTEQLHKIGGKAEKMIPLLPPADKLSLLKKEGFLKLYDAVTMQLERIGAAEAGIEAVDDICDTYSKTRYPATAVKPMTSKLEPRPQQTGNTGEITH